LLGTAAGLRGMLRVQPLISTQESSRLIGSD
jgi:hypothetical protein